MIVIICYNLYIYLYCNIPTLGCMLHVDPSRRRMAVNLSCSCVAMPMTQRTRAMWNGTWPAWSAPAARTSRHPDVDSVPYTAPIVGVLGVRRLTGCGPRQCFPATAGSSLAGSLEF